MAQPNPARKSRHVDLPILSGHLCQRSTCLRPALPPTTHPPTHPPRPVCRHRPDGQSHQRCKRPTIAPLRAKLARCATTPAPALAHASLARFSKAPRLAHPKLHAAVTKLIDSTDLIMVHVKTNEPLLYATTAVPLLAFISHSRLPLTTRAAKIVQRTHVCCRTPHERAHESTLACPSPSPHVLG